MEIKSFICLLALVVGSTSATKQDTHQTVPENVEDDILSTVEEDMKVDSARTNLSLPHMDGISPTDNSSTDGGNKREDVDRTNITQQHENGTSLGKSPAVVVTTTTAEPTAPNQAEVTSILVPMVQETINITNRDGKFLSTIHNAVSSASDSVQAVASGFYNKTKEGLQNIQENVNEGVQNLKNFVIAQATGMDRMNTTITEITTVSTTSVSTISKTPSVSTTTNAPISVHTISENSSVATRPPVPLLRNTNKYSTLLYTAVAGGCLMVICLVVLAVVCRKRRTKSIHGDQAELHNISNPSGHRGSAHDSENSLYGVTTTNTTQQRNSAHNSENSLYGATIAHPAQRRGSAHESENSLYGAVI